LIRRIGVDLKPESLFPRCPKAPKPRKFVEARAYVEKHFPNNWGLSTGPHLFATSREESLSWLDRFMHERLEKFGDYEDAIVHHQPVLYHSVLSPMINIGLLSPQEVLDRVLDFAQRGTAINSLEGFVRQVMGWREFIHLVYHQSGRQQRTTNYWGFKRPIPDSFRKGETGIAPIDLTIQKLNRTGYCHHIERLMVLGNFFLLCEFDPDEVYQWFMEFFIDSYDWVMVPNVYGMTQFADGGLMTTKPYISGSNYLSKMSDYPKGNWQATWDGLFWRFMDVHREFFLSNPRLGMLVHMFDKMEAGKKKQHLDNAEDFLKGLL
jgi:deoxyribodipyrimidine photolyase-related protein